MLAFASTSQASSPASKTANSAGADIISIGGDVTEIVYALGLGDRIAAVDTTSLYPAAALREKRNVGYMRALSAEGVLSIPAKLILASDGAGPPETIAALKASSIKFVTIPDEPSADGVFAKIKAIANAVSKAEAGRKISSTVRRELASLSELRKKVKTQRRILFVLSTTAGRILIGGQGTSAAGLFSLAGAINAAQSVNGFKPITPEALVAMAPDAIIVMKRRGDHGAENLRSLPAIQQVPAGRNDMIREMDGLYLLGFGPRTPAAARDVLLWLYPDLAGKG